MGALAPAWPLPYVQSVASSRDYYRTLGVSKGASDAEIKRAYRRLARQLHPDVTGDDPRSTERFKEITEAYEVLSDPRRRRSYDLFGGPGPTGRPGSDAGPQPFAGFADAFTEVLRRTQRRSAGPEPGIDVERTLAVTLAEAATGCEKVLELDVTRPCAVCEGKGWPKDKPPETCPDCAGTGTKGGTFPLKRTCPRCEGLGNVRRYTCKACAGEGHKRDKERLKVTVPAGVDDGTRLRLKGRGEAGRNGGIAGDLYVVVEVEPDPRFERDGADLRTTLRVGLRDALLGGRAEVPLPDGSAVMTIPPGTQGGQIFRIRGRGMPRLAGDRSGDVLVTVQLRIPRELSADARALVEKLAAAVPEL
jgi:molecular chaperone DnaJ